MARLIQGDLLDFINQQLELAAQEGRDTETEYFSDFMSEPTYPDETDPSEPEDQSDTPPDASLDEVIQNFVNDCYRMRRFPTLEEAETIVLLNALMHKYN